LRKCEYFLWTERIVNARIRRSLKFNVQSLKPNRECTRSRPARDLSEYGARRGRESSRWEIASGGSGGPARRRKQRPGRSRSPLLFSTKFDQFRVVSTNFDQKTCGARLRQQQLRRGRPHGGRGWGQSMARSSQASRPGRAPNAPARDLSEFGVELYLAVGRSLPRRPKIAVLRLPLAIYRSCASLRPRVRLFFQKLGRRSNVALPRTW